jgi:hypothetical protein
MSVVHKVYIGTRNDLEFLMGEDVINETFTVKNADGSAYDFTGFTDVNLFIYNGDTRKRLVKTLVVDTNLTIPTPENGIILLNIDYSTDIGVTLKPEEYYYKLTYLDASSRTITVCFGPSKFRR